MEYFLSVIIGIVSSLIATAVFVGLVELTHRVLLPWYADKIYRGVRVDGKWSYRKYEKAGFGKTLQLKQKGEEVTGIYAHWSKTEHEDITEYYVTGILRDTYLTLIARPVSNELIDAIAFILRVGYEGGRQTLKGGYVCTSE